MQSNEVHYKIPWRSKGNFPGHHPSQQPGGGLQFRNHVNLIDAPDPRRFDIRASLRDPFEQLKVRVYQQTSSITVFVVADLSASMDYRGAHHKKQIIADFVECMSYSAFRTGDLFGFYGGADESMPGTYLSPTFNRAAGLNLANNIRTMNLLGRSIDGLIKATDFIGSKRALVFLLSDFHYPLDQIEELRASLAHHDVVPVAIWDRNEYERLPGFGLTRVLDPETGNSRLLFMRGALRRRISEIFAERKNRLFELFSRHGRAPIMLQDGFRSDEVSRYFLG